MKLLFAKYIAAMAIDRGEKRIHRGRRKLSLVMFQAVRVCVYIYMENICFSVCVWLIYLFDYLFACVNLLFCLYICLFCLFRHIYHRSFVMSEVFLHALISRYCSFLRSHFSFLLCIFFSSFGFFDVCIHI